MMDRNSYLLKFILPVLTFISMLTALYMVFIYAPEEETMGAVQKIFYFHAPSAWIAFLAFFIIFLCSLIYLIQRGKKWDDIAGASAETGIFFCTLVLITGPIWAKPVWGIWWTWDLRLTLTLVLWLIYAGYLMLRHYVTDPEKKATYSAVLGVVGFIDVPLVYMSIRLWRTQHPSPVIGGGLESGLDPAMGRAFATCLVAFTILFINLLIQRVTLVKLREQLDGLHEQAESSKGDEQ